MDIVGLILAKYPAAVVTSRQAEAGRLIEVRLPNRSIFPVRLFVEWGSEEEAAAVILDRLAPQS